MQLLTELDGVEALNGVFVFAATRYFIFTFHIHDVFYNMTYTENCSQFTAVIV